ncbi:TSUP family transporter [Ramlibacter terrae]|uniref:Probable membrane transporter protein n=1 Tax=Ramlibacter terrae TaxID=2732511 RepID=A0ABX6P2Y8_9BURK|nr:TSUP family transporter [Ramlibacter terrae]
MSGWQVAGFLLCVALATCAQSVTGFALALIMLGLAGLFELAPLPDVANVATVISLLNAAIALRGTRKWLDAPMLRATIPASIVGVAVGVALLAWLSANVVMGLRLLLGVVVIACALVVLLRAEPLATRSSTASFAGFGVLSGMLGGLFAASGPPLVYHFYRQPISLEALRDTLMAALAAGGVLRLLMVVASGQFSPNALFLCALAAPVAIGLTWWFKRRPLGWSRDAVLKIVCALLIVTGVGLVGPAVRALAA